MTEFDSIQQKKLIEQLCRSYLNAVLKLLSRCILRTCHYYQKRIVTNSDDQVTQTCLQAQHALTKNTDKLGKIFCSELKGYFNALPNLNRLVTSTAEMTEPPWTDEQVALGLDTMIQRCRNDCPTLLRQINCRLCLLLKIESLDSQFNPFDPGNLVRCFEIAQQPLKLDFFSRMILFKHFELEVLKQLEKPWHQANDRLLMAGVIIDPDQLKQNQTEHFPVSSPRRVQRQKNPSSAKDNVSSLVNRNVGQHYRDTVDALTEKDWITLATGKRPLRCKLVQKNNGQLHFENRLGNPVLTMSKDELAVALYTGRAKIISQRPMVDQALHRVSRTLFRPFKTNSSTNS